MVKKMVKKTYPIDTPKKVKTCYLDEDSDEIICELKMKSGREVRWPLEDILTILMGGTKYDQE